MSIKIKEAVAVTMFVDKMNIKVRNLLILIGIVIASVFTIYILYLSFNWIMNPGVLLQKTVTTQMPMVYMYLCVPISLLFMSMHFINWLIESFQISKKGKMIT